MNRKGDYKWGIMISLILGLMVLSLSLYFIFNELWTDDDAERQLCRQSIQLRAALPDVETGAITFHSFKEEFPLKCKTMVKEIDKEDVDNGDAAVIIAESMAECWFLYDKGDVNIFPANIVGVNTVCVPCARIHLTEEAKKAVGDEGINIENALKDLRMDGGVSYYSYLMNSGKKFPAFSPGAGFLFDLSGAEFKIESLSAVGLEWVTLINRLEGDKISMLKSSDVFLPKVLYPKKGDLMINYGTMYVKGAKGDFGNNVPYLFYFQTAQEPNPFDEVIKKNIFGNKEFCESWEGIPA